MIDVDNVVKSIHERIDILRGHSLTTCDTEAKSYVETTKHIESIQSELLSLNKLQVKLHSVSTLLGGATCWKLLSHPYSQYWSYRGDNSDTLQKKRILAVLRLIATDYNRSKDSERYEEFKASMSNFINKALLPLDQTINKIECDINNVVDGQHVPTQEKLFYYTESRLRPETDQSRGLARLFFQNSYFRMTLGAGLELVPYFFLCVMIHFFSMLWAFDGSSIFCPSDPGSKKGSYDPDDPTYPESNHHPSDQNSDFCLFNQPEIYVFFTVLVLLSFCVKRSINAQKPPLVDDNYTVDDHDKEFHNLCDKYRSHLKLLAMTKTKIQDYFSNKQDGALGDSDGYMHALILQLSKKIEQSELEFKRLGRLKPSKNQFYKLQLSSDIKEREKDRADNIKSTVTY